MKVIRTKGGKSCKICLDLDVEQDVSRLWVHEYDMRIGTSIVKMGGIGGVETNEEHRMKGYARKVMADSNAYMMESGFDVGMLFGISNFYTKFGYVTTLPEYHISLRAENAADAQSKYPIRKLEKRDLDRIVEIYQSNNRLRSGTIVRTIEEWDGFKEGSEDDTKAEPYVVTDEKDKILGYFVCNADEEENCTIEEIGYEKEDIFETMIKTFADRAEKLESDSVNLIMPPDHPFAIFCRRYGCHVSINYPKNGGGMMRIINLCGMLTKIEKELSRRLALSHLNKVNCRIAVGTQELGTEVIKIEKGDVKIADDKDANLFSSQFRFSDENIEWTLEIPQYKLIQLVMGYRGIYNLVIDSDVKVSEEAMPILDQLFPMGYPYVWQPDRF